jgi:hypothetical protein
MLFAELHEGASRSLALSRESGAIGSCSYGPLGLSAGVLGRASEVSSVA